MNDSTDMIIIEELKKKLSAITSVDFGYYKTDFFKRAIEGRTQKLGLGSVRSYCEHIDANRQEAFKFKEFLSVYHSQFIRDPMKYRVLKDSVLPELIKRSRERSAASAQLLGAKPECRLRIWSAGCAGGEEPYSIAMVISEVLERELQDWNISIFATDLNPVLLDKARKGIYAIDEFSGKEIDRHYIDKYFARAGADFVISEDIRRMVCFAESNLISDRPLSGMDIIFCRNVLIYFDLAPTRKILTDFYGSLNGEGYLVLGNSEILEDYFFCRFRKIRKHGEFVYRKIVEGTPEYLEMIEKQKHIMAGLGIKP